ILTDLRSSRTPVRSWQQNPSMMGERQKDWFKQQLLAAKQRGELIAWVNVVPWISRPNPESDTWGGYAADRREIADFLKEHAIANLVILSGDAHMVAMDDGTHSDYATAGGAPVPVIHSAPLDRPGSAKGGPYAIGPFANTSVVPPHDGQWVRMSVRNEGGAEVCLGFEGLRVSPRAGRSRRLFEWSRCFSAAADTLHVGVPDSLGAPPRIAVRVGA